MGNNEKIVISFCIPTFNRCEVVLKCVKNILRYKGADIEVIVSDNDSPDKTQEYLKQITDIRFKYFRNTENDGVGYNIDRVLNEASGDFCFLLSDEDEVNIEKISILIEIIRRSPDLAVIYGEIQPYDFSEDTYNGHVSRRLTAGEHAIKEMSFKHAYLSGIIVNKNLYRQIGASKYWYQKDLFYPHEYLCFLLAFLGDILIIKDIIVFTHDYDNITYCGNRGITSAYSFEGRLQTCKDRTLIIYENIDNNLLREKLVLENFKHMMTAATAGEYIIFREKNNEKMQIRDCEGNLQRAISKFVSEFNKFVFEENINLTKNFYYNEKKQCAILRIKVLGIHFYGSYLYRKVKMFFDCL